MASARLHALIQFQSQLDANEVAFLVSNINASLQQVHGMWDGKKNESAANWAVTHPPKLTTFSFRLYSLCRRGRGVLRLPHPHHESRPGESRARAGL